MSMISLNVGNGLRRRRPSSYRKESDRTLQFLVPSAQIHQTPQFDGPIQTDLGKNENRVVFSVQQSIGETSKTTSAQIHQTPQFDWPIQIDLGKKEKGVVFYEQQSSGESSGNDSVAMAMAPKVSDLGWGRCYPLSELELATDEFADKNVIGEGVYGIVYCGVLADNSVVAVKKLFNNRRQAEKEFKVEVDCIGRVRHTNLVRLLGYCVEGDYRMLVYEYLDNGNLKQWLHGDVGEFSPLTWETRMNIILGAAKGLAHLHEGLERKVLHRNIKSSNVLLDQQWNSKVSDFGLAKLLSAESNYVTTGVIETDGYVAPEYASTGMLNEKTDIYSFGILMLEIISGRMPVDHNRPPEEVKIIEWFRTMVTLDQSEGIVDPKMPGKPSSSALDLAICLVCICVQLRAQKRPSMEYVLERLEEVVYGSNMALRMKLDRMRTPR